MNPFSPFLMGGPGGFQPQAPAPQAQMAQQQQRPGLGSIFGPLAMGLGAAIASNNPGAGFPVMQQAQQNRTQRQQLNATAQWLEKTGNSDLVPLVAAGQAAAALQMAQQRNKAKEPQIPSFGKTPVYGTDPKSGKTVLGTVGDDGSFKILDTPGFEASSGVDKVDLGTHYGLLNKRTGEMVGTLPKENYQEAFDKGRGGAVGKGVGEAEEAFASRSSKMAGIRQVVAELDLLAEKGTYTYTGQAVDAVRRQLGADPTEGALARAEYIAKVDNQVLPLLRDTFGAAFTQKEGESLRATLGDPNKSPKEKQAVLRAFIEQKQRDVEALGSRLGREPPVPQGGAQGGAGVRRKYNPATGQIE